MTAIFCKLASRFASFRDDCRGAVYIWTAFGIIGMLGFGGLAIDMSYFYAMRGQLQTSADSAALAGAMRMSNATEMKAEAKKYAKLNVSGDTQIIADADIQRGTWNFNTKTFSVGGANANAVRVTTRMSQANGNPAGTFLASVFGIGNVNISTTSVAAYATDDAWDVLVVQDVTGSFSAEIGDARDANHVLLDCLQQRTSGDSLVGMVTFTGIAQDYSPGDVHRSRRRRAGAQGQLGAGHGDPRGRVAQRKGPQRPPDQPGPHRSRQRHGRQGGRQRHLDLHRLLRRE
jgi:Flp pilus assembly protein TadG